MLEKAIERGWRVLVQTTDDLRLKALDDLLWTYRPESFLPHAAARDIGDNAPPIVLASDGANPHAAALRVYVEGATIDLDPASAAAYERVILMFDGGNEAELEAARSQWSRLKAQGFTLAYWQQGETGRWERRM